MVIGALRDRRKGLEGERRLAGSRADAHAVRDDVAEERIHAIVLVCRVEGQEARFQVPIHKAFAFPLKLGSIFVVSA